MEAIIRKQQKRRSESNKRSAFRIRGRPVNPERIDRYIREHPIRPFGISTDKTLGGNVVVPCMVPAIIMFICMTIITHL
jgi:hypothetical protein